MNVGIIEEICVDDCCKFKVTLINNDKLYIKTYVKPETVANSFRGRNLDVLIMDSYMYDDFKTCVLPCLMSGPGKLVMLR